jgi:hypothetical protein
MSYVQTELIEMLEKNVLCVLLVKSGSFMRFGSSHILYICKPYYDYFTQVWSRIYYMGLHLLVLPLTFVQPRNVKPKFMHSKWQKIYQNGAFSIEHGKEP